MFKFFKLGAIPLSPFLFAVYPILSLFSHNIEQVYYNVLIFPITVSAVGTFLLILLLKLFIADKLKISAIASTFLILFFSYGYVREFALKSGEFGVIIARHRYFFLIWILVFILSTYFLKNTRHLFKLTRFLNVFGIALISFSIAGIVIYKINEPKLNSLLTLNPEDEKLIKIISRHEKPLPDIYYIVPDAYANYYTLRDDFKYDNGEFVKFLRDKGFWVPLNSKSNYHITGFSLPSSLNMEYIDYLAEEMKGRSPDDFSVPYKMIRNNKVMRILKGGGYKFVNFNSGWAVTNHNKYADIEYDNNFFEEFSILLARTTVLRPWFSSSIGSSFAAVDLYEQTRKRVLFTFDKLGNEIPYIESPKFVFAHIGPPHVPYVFGPDGEKLSVAGYDEPRHTQDDYNNFYLGQLKFITKQIQMMIESILANSKTPPIIIIQSDHGQELECKMTDKILGDETHSDRCLKAVVSNFAAYYIPNKKISGGEISPVNTFRTVFNAYFNSSYEILENTHYYNKEGYVFDKIPPQRLK